jgi:hypothetical protein
MVRVLIGTPTFEYHANCVDEFVEALRRQTEQRFDLMLVDNSRGLEHAESLRSKGLPVFRSPYYEVMRERMTAARNLIREVLLRGDYTHLLFLDQDVILPPCGLERLLSHRLPVISGVYCKQLGVVRYAMLVLQNRRPDSSGLIVTPIDEIDEGDVLEIEAAGFGCLLLERRLCQSTDFRYDRHGTKDADLIFCADIRAHGFQIFCDTRVHCLHRYVERDFGRNSDWGVW